MVAQYLLPLTAITLTYTRIAARLWGSRCYLPPHPCRAPGQRNRVRDGAVLANKKRVIKMLLVVVLMFCLSWLPYQVALLPHPPLDLLHRGTARPLHQPVSLRQPLLPALTLARHEQQLCQPLHLLHLQHQVQDGVQAQAVPQVSRWRVIPGPGGRGWWWRRGGGGGEGGERVEETGSPALHSPSPPNSPLPSPTVLELNIPLLDIIESQLVASSWASCPLGGGCSSRGRGRGGRRCRWRAPGRAPPPATAGRGSTGAPPSPAQRLTWGQHSTDTGLNSNLTQLRQDITTGSNIKTVTTP